MIARVNKSCRVPTTTGYSRRSRRAALSCTQRLHQRVAQKRVRLPLATKFILGANNVTPTQHTETPATTSTQFQIPRTLSKPTLREVDMDSIQSIYPELAGVQPEYIREKLVLIGSEMLAAVASVRAQPPPSCLPKELEIVVNDMIAAQCPTHMLAVYSQSPEPLSHRRRVTIFPTHSLVLASHCTNLPALPISRPDVTASTVTLPVVPLCLPSAETFPILQSYLYTKRVDDLVSSLIPFLMPGSAVVHSPEHLDDVYSKMLATTCSDNFPALIRFAKVVNGLWRNACALGVDDDQLWSAISYAWEIIVSAMKIHSHA